MFSRRHLVALAVVAATVAPVTTHAASALYAPAYTTARIVVPIHFPVLGADSYVDTFLACRDGCARKHMGQDLMGPKMRPLVAAFNGVVSSLRRETSIGGGNYLSVQGDNGWTANYLHVNNDRPGTDDGQGTAAYAFAPGIEVGVRVVAGQLVGWSGDSGNAESTGPHLHFELRRGGAWDGLVYNAFFSLQAAYHDRAPVTSGPHPEGTLVRGCATCPPYLVSGGAKHYLNRDVAAALGLRLASAVTVSAAEMAYYPAGKAVALPDGRAYRDAAKPDGPIWFAAAHYRLAVPDATALAALGIAPTRVRAVPALALGTLAAAPAGVTLPQSVAYEGALLRAAGGTDTWYVSHGERHLVPDAYTLASWGLAAEDAIEVPVEQVAALPPVGSPLVLRDGPVVVDGAKRMYVVSEGTRRAVPSWALYRMYGWNTAAVTTAPLPDVYRLPVGAPLPGGERSSYYY